MVIQCPAKSAARASNVAGGQIRISAGGLTATTAAAIYLISASCAISSCIFQLPAIRGRIGSALYVLDGHEPDSGQIAGDAFHSAITRLAGWAGL